jgi:16S rRNA (uracil1498-N3)-methyltransferase
MHRFYLPPDQGKGDQLALVGGEAHHALHVLRVRRGERVTVLDGQGQQLLCEALEGGRDRLGLRVLERKPHPPLLCQITLLQAIPKGKLIESIIQKATELGAFRIVPLLSERVVTQLDKKDAAHKAEKWQAVAIEAIKQCGAPWLPRVEAPMTPKEFLARQEPVELPLIGSLQPGSKHPRVFFQEFERQHQHRPRTASIWIGPEGDFTQEEVALVQDSGAHPITLGPLVLRTETAATYCLSVLNYEIQAP